MPRKSLHTLINMLDEFGTFIGRKVVIEITNGTDVKCSYDPPLGEDSAEVREAEKVILTGGDSDGY